MAVRFVSRERWGAKRPKSVTKLAPSELSGVAVHWFGSPKAAKSHARCAELLRSVQNTHMGPGGLGEASGGADIGYNHAVCPHGKAFTLRGFGVQTGANGDGPSNRTFAAVVFMAGTGDKKPSAEALDTLAEVIRLWQKKGAGPLVKPHQFFTGSDCPGPELLDWVDLKPPPWKAGARPRIPLKDETPDWLLDFVFWRLAEGGAKKARPKGLPKPIPESAHEATARMERMVNVMGPQESFVDWVEWRRAGGKKEERPRSVPRKIPKAWKDSAKRLEQIFTGEPPPPEPPEPPEPPPDTGPVSARTKLLAAPRATREQLELHMLARDHGGYSDANVRGILKRYVDACKSAGLDPLLVVSQMVLETGNLTSFWSQIPRRNPAGIGVTGEPGAGISFSSWEKAVRAHVGRLLAYALPAGSESAAQRKLIDEALAVRPLPDDRRGIAPTLKGLAGTWAADKKYAGKIARVANEIRGA
jgi:Mannosyl-glycoprotein endo-beta-N-acetylglucosaminidase